MQSPMPRSRLVRTLALLVAALLTGLHHKANAVTVVVDASWVQAGFGSAGDRCLDEILLQLHAGDTLEVIVPAPEASPALRPLVGFTLQRRPSVRRAALIATRRMLNEVLASVDPAAWPRLAEILPQLAASPRPDRHREQRYVILGALTAADPPAIDLDLRRLLRGRRITVVDLAQVDSSQRASRLEAWQRFFSAAGVGRLDILSTTAPRAVRAARAHTQSITCSGRRLQVLDHELE